jgi:hypothetical protein
MLNTLFSPSLHILLSALGCARLAMCTLSSSTHFSHFSCCLPHTKWSWENWREWSWVHPLEVPPAGCILVLLSLSDYRVLILTCCSQPNSTIKSFGMIHTPYLQLLLTVSLKNSFQVINHGLQCHPFLAKSLTNILGSFIANNSIWWKLFDS